MKVRIFSPNDNRKHLALSVLVACLGATPPAVALQIPGLKPAAPAAPKAPAAAGPGVKAPSVTPPLLLGQVGNTFVECMTIANLALSKGNPAMCQLAADNYRAAIKFNPNDAPAHLGLGHSLQGLGETDNAIAEYFEALRLKPDYAAARFHLGTIMMKQDRWDEAAGQFMQVIKLAPNDLATRGQLGICYEQKGQIDAALEQFKYITATDDKNVDGHYNLGVAFDLKEDWKSAAKEYRRTLELNPKHQLAYVGLGNALINLRRYADAITVGKAAIKADSTPPKNHYALIMLGRAYELAKDESEAQKMYNRAIQIAPKAPECQNLMQNMLKMRAKKLGLNNLPGLN